MCAVGDRTDDLNFLVIEGRCSVRRCPLIFLSDGKRVTELRPSVCGRSIALATATGGTRRHSLPLWRCDPGVGSRPSSALLC